MACLQGNLCDHSHVMYRVVNCARKCKTIKMIIHAEMNINYLICKEQSWPPLFCISIYDDMTSEI